MLPWSIPSIATSRERAMRTGQCTAVLSESGEEIDLGMAIKDILEDGDTVVVKHSLERASFAREWRAPPWPAFSHTPFWNAQRKGSRTRNGTCAALGPTAKDKARIARDSRLT